MMQTSEIEMVLAKLRVKPGLRGESRELGGPWRVGFWYDRDRSVFTLVLSYKDRSKTVSLAPDMVETRGKSPWLADNVWRLSTVGIARQAEGITAAIAATESAAHR